MTSVFSRRHFLAASLAAGAFIATGSPAFALFSQSNEASTKTVDHSMFDVLLKRYVAVGGDGVNRVDYAGLKSGGRAQLEMYLTAMAMIPVSDLKRMEQFAYWANLYNALTLKVIVDAYPVQSIRQTGGLLGFGGPWKAKRFTVEGQEISLDDIEHNTLRANWNEPRIHYAVNCASYGCPNLQPMAFTAQNLNSLLTIGARQYINHPRGVSFRNNNLYVSSIYSWFKEDFGGNDAGVIAHLRRYAEPALADKLATVSRVAGDDYDWSLNDTI